ncbi:MAG: hypothetical protein ACLFQV_01560 [Vulcanimicrobiota bacterium]
MKRNTWVITMLMVSFLVLGFVMAQPAQAFTEEDSRPDLHWRWENDHATMINALLITANDEILRNSEAFVKMYEDYAIRDPLLEVYGLREVAADSEMDAMLVGMKVNNLIYLIHCADENPMARKYAIKELRLMQHVLKSNEADRFFPYWADLLEEGRYPSTRMSHMYVHYLVDAGDDFYERIGVSHRFFYWMGYQINDFTVANLCDNQEWMEADQDYLAQLYSIRKMYYLKESIQAHWKNFMDADLSCEAGVSKAQDDLNYIKGHYMDRQMGNDW